MQRYYIETFNIQFHLCYFITFAHLPYILLRQFPCLTSSVERKHWLVGNSFWADTLTFTTVILQYLCTEGKLLFLFWSSLSLLWISRIFSLVFPFVTDSVSQMITKRCHLITCVKQNDRKTMSLDHLCHNQGWWSRKYLGRQIANLLTSDIFDACSQNDSKK